jgi:dihydroorotate dehydrogenase
VNKVGLWNPGYLAWKRSIAPTIDFKNRKIVVSLAGTEDELVQMAMGLNDLELVALEINVSCPNTGERSVAQQIVASVLSIKKVSRHPIWLKLSADQKDLFREIATRTCGCLAAFSLNSVPYHMAFPYFRAEESPVAKVGKPGAGGVSGKPAQKDNWEAVRLLALFGHGTPVIAPSIMERADLAKVRALGAKAVSFGAIHCRTPWKPTQIVEQEQYSWQ